MNIWLCAVAIIGLWFPGGQKEKHEPVLGQPAGELRVTVLEVSLKGVVRVRMTNESNHPVRIWRASNSWGASRWRVIRIRDGNSMTFYENPYKIFTRNVPSYDEIAGKGHSDFSLELNEGDWCGFGYCAWYDERGFDGKEVDFRTGDTVVAIYDVPPSNEAQKYEVWVGVAAGVMVVK